MLNDIDHDENEMKSGFKNGFESNLQEGFLLGMIDYLKFTCVKWNFEDLKALLEKSKNILEVKQIRDNILMRIINNK